MGLVVLVLALVCVCVCVCVLGLVFLLVSVLVLVGTDVVGGVEAGHRSHLQLAAGGMMVKLRVLRCRR